MTVDREPLEATVTSRADRVEVHLKGELDVLSVPQFNTTMDAVWTTDRSQVVVDLSELTFIDLRGVEALLEATRTARAQSISFDILHRSEAIRRLAELLHVDEGTLLPGLFD